MRGMKEKDERDSLSREHMMERRGEEFGKKNPRQMAAHLPWSPGSMDNPYGRNSHLGNRVLAALELLIVAGPGPYIEPKQQPSSGVGTRLLRIQRNTDSSSVVAPTGYQ